MTSRNAMGALAGKIEGVSLLKKKISNFVSRDRIACSSGWLSPYNVRHNFTAVSRLQAPLAKLVEASSALKTLRRSVGDELQTIFQPPTVSHSLDGIVSLSVCRAGNR